MNYRVISQPAAEPVSVEEACLHCRVDADDTAEYALLAAWITAARERAEHYAGRTFADSTLEVAYADFPANGQPLVLPVGPADTVTYIQYDDQDGNAQTLDSAVYALSPYGPARVVYLAEGDDWPETSGGIDCVRVRYVSRTDCPQAAKSAMLLAVGHLYENRQEVIVGPSVATAELPQGFFALLDTCKVWSA